jgi:hypothetical protein
VSIRRVLDVIMKATFAVDPADADFANGKSDAVANIIWGLCARSRTPIQQDAHESNRQSFVTESDVFLPT